MSKVYEFKINDNVINIFINNKRFLSVGASFSVNGNVLNLLPGEISELKGSKELKFLMADYAKDIAYLTITPGEVYTFKNADDGTLIDRNFIEAKGINSETDMNYVNN